MACKDLLAIVGIQSRPVALLSASSARHSRDKRDNSSDLPQDKLAKAYFMVAAACPGYRGTYCQTVITSPIVTFFPSFMNQ